MLVPRGLRFVRVFRRLSERPEAKFVLRCRFCSAKEKVPMVRFKDKTG